MKPIYQYLIAFILLISIGISGYFLGRSTKTCPKIDAPILPPENDTIKKLVEKLATLETENNNLKKRKHEIKVIYKSELKPYVKTDAPNNRVYWSNEANSAIIRADSAIIPFIFREWANYYGK